MLKKTIDYVDYNGVKRTEDSYFNLTQAEITEMEMSTTGGLSEMIQNIIKAQDVPAIIKIFKDLILKAYGVKSPDGKRFIKIDENGHRLADDFVQTEAYSVLFMELATNADAGAEFINGIIPQSIAPNEDNKVVGMPNKVAETPVE